MTTRLETWAARFTDLSVSTRMQRSLMSETLKIDKDLHTRKKELLAYLRARAAESLTTISKTFGVKEYRERAIAVNKSVAIERERLATQLRQLAAKEKWSNEVTLPNILLLTHCSNVVMLESRNSVWPYEYMTFSRRIGELWEPFCNICFEYPVRDDVSLFTPPVFEDVKKRLSNEIREFIAGLNITRDQKKSLLNYYDKVWSLVTSGEIQLSVDLHFVIDKTRYIVDFKSGFSSNEKGNTNRLLLVASIYKNIEPEDYRCLILVRSAEDLNNHYLQTLKNSGLWEVHCGGDAYAVLKEFSGFNMKDWIEKNVKWKEDISGELCEHLTDGDLLKYLTW